MKIPRGLIVEPSNSCTGTCAGCPIPDNPAVLKPEQLNSWLTASPTKLVTIHFSGKHSDPLASPILKDLTDTAIRNCSMLSISTIGLGITPEYAKLPVDRWILSLPAATEKSWRAVRGNDRFEEALKAFETVQNTVKSMVEVVLTLWKPSSGDREAFGKLAERKGWQYRKTVFGRFDPAGHHVGRLENLALEVPDCPYMLNENRILTLKKTPQDCPLVSCLFLDATGTLRPCPFTGNESPYLKDPSPNSWDIAKQWTRQKRNRSFPACEWCP
jgi:MoaA/NifB/PqqE/SkfB family radical SAM enzyme